jgi:elongation factor Ts
LYLQKPTKAAPKAEAPKAEAGAISAKLVKDLRQASGAGMMDCKKALAECGGDLEAAKDYLRKKGLASADKKAGRIAAEGSVASYIHAGSKLGVLVEVNCETDFVARGEKFQELVNDIAMQIAACPQIEVVSTDDVSAAMLEREKAIEMEKEDLKSKPEEIREKIVQGRLDKIAKEMALLEQPFIKDTSKTVAEVIKESIASIGENIQVGRFDRYVLGEGIEKATTDFAAEVAAQTGRA